MNETKSTAVATVPRARVLQQMADRLSVEPGKMLETLRATVFKAAQTNEQLMMLCVVANQYGLNPFTREIYAFPDSKSGGVVPVVGVDGWSRIINEHPQFDGMDFEWSPDGATCTCTVYRKDRAHPTKVTEYLAECKRGTDPWKTHPRRMLRHKTMIQAARLAFGFAGIYDEDEAGRIAGDATVLPDGKVAGGDAPALPSSAAPAAPSKLRGRLLGPGAPEAAGGQPAGNALVLEGETVPAERQPSDSASKGED